MNQDADFTAKIAIFGDKDSGKEHLLVRILDGTYSDSYISTIGREFGNKLTETNNTLIKQNYNLTRVERGIVLSEQRGSHTILVCIDLSKPDALEKAKEYLASIQRPIGIITGRDPDIILVGTNSEASVIEPQKLIDFAAQNDMRSIEVSAKNNTNIAELQTMINKKMIEKFKIPVSQKAVPNLQTTQPSPSRNPFSQAKKILDKVRTKKTTPVVKAATATVSSETRTKVSTTMPLATPNATTASPPTPPTVQATTKAPSGRPLPAANRLVRELNEQQHIAKAVQNPAVQAKVSPNPVAAPAAPSVAQTPSTSSKTPPPIPRRRLPDVPRNTESRPPAPPPREQHVQATPPKPPPRTDLPVSLQSTARRGYLPQQKVKSDQFKAELESKLQQGKPGKESIANEQENISNTKQTPIPPKRKG